MDIVEMHRAFKIGIDKIDSQQVPPFENEEIDLLLNQGQDRFVKQRYGGNNVYKTGFEQTQKRIDDLRTIVVRQDGSVKPFVNEDNVYEFSVPRDYNYLINLRICTTKASCGKDFINTSLYIGSYRDRSIVISKTHIDPIGTGPHFHPIEVFVPSDILLNNIGKIVGGKKKMYNIIFVGQLEEIKDIDFEWVMGTQVQHDDLSQLLNDPFNKPQPGDPLYLFEGEQILFYASKEFVVNWVEITYLRELKRLTSFPQDIIDNPVKFTDICELPVHVHQEAVNSTIDLVLEGIESPRHQSFQHERQLEE